MGSNELGWWPVAAVNGISGIFDDELVLHCMVLDVGKRDAISIAIEEVAISLGPNVPKALWQKSIPVDSLIVRFASNGFLEVLPICYIEMAFLEGFGVVTIVNHSVPEVLDSLTAKEDMVNIFRELGLG